MPLRSIHRLRRLLLPPRCRARAGLALAGLASAALLATACAPRAERAESPYPILTVSNGPVGPSFSLQADAGELHLIFPEIETLSLKLDILRLDGLGRTPQIHETLFLDRIRRSQELESLFGDHFYALYSREQQIFYLDQEKEDHTILKWLHRAQPTDAWTIDALPQQGRILAGLRDDRGRMRLFFEGEEALLSGASPRFAPLEKVLDPFAAEGDVSVLDGSGAAGFTVYNRLAGRLLQVRQDGPVASVRPLLRAGRVHHAWLGPGGGLEVLTYDLPQAELSVWTEESPGGAFRQVPVAPCRGTHSVYGFSVPAGNCFVFNEVTGAGDGRWVHQIALLHPGPSGYEKEVLVRSREPILKVKTLREGGRLVVAFSQDTLKLIAVDLDRLGISSGS